MLPRRSGAEVITFDCTSTAVESGIGGKGDGDSTEMFVSSLGSALPVLTAMREHLAGEAMAAVAAANDAGGSPTIADIGSGSASPHFPGSNAFVQWTRSPRHRMALLLRWVEEQEDGAAATYERTKATLLQLKTAASKRALSRSASRVWVKLDRVVWQLCNPEKQPFVQASLKGVSFDRHRNRDHSGK